MKKQNKTQTTIYYIETIDIKQLIDKHKLLSNQQSKLNVNILTAKYEYLIHLICQRHYCDRFGVITLNSKILQKTFQSAYNIMLDVLEKFKIIYILPYYEVGRVCRSINLLDPYKSRIKLKQPTDLLQHNKFNKLCSDALTNANTKRKQNDIKSMVNEVSEPLSILETYDKYLKQLQITNKDEFNNYIQSKYYYSDKQEQYYNNIANQYLYHNKSFYHKAIDNNNRIYSILTSTPRYIKNFLNIKYSIDIKNSHPLLFNHLIINKLNISISLLNSFYKFIISINKSSLINNNYNINSIYTTYGIENIRDSICINKKQKDEFARIPDDIWLYIFNTSTGRFWDDFKNNFIEYGLNRTDVKQTIFHEVFYSTSTSAYGKIFAKAFKTIYPNVFELLKKMKLERKYAVSETMKGKPKTLLEYAKAKFECEFAGKTKHISNDMMKLESTIFFEILEKIYARRDCKALTIHDAIIVLDTNSKKECNIDVIENIMRKVYKKYHLYPQFGIDKFNPLKWHDELEREKANQPLIEAKIKELEEHAAKDKKSAIEILDLINNNELELIVESDNTLHFHRLFKHSMKRGEKGKITKKYKQIQKASKKFLKS
jgi:hypothetical protein